MGQYLKENWGISTGHEQNAAKFPLDSPARELVGRAPMFLPLFQKIWSWATLKNLEPAIIEAHREHILYRTKLSIFTIMVAAPLTTLPYFFLSHRHAFRAATTIISILELICIGLLSCLNLDFFKRHYHLGGFLLVGVCVNGAISMLIPLAGGGQGHFLFPYILVDLGMATFLPGSLALISATLALIPVFYISTEWFGRQNLLADFVVANLTLLSVGSMLGIIANQILVNTFLRDKRNQFKLEVEKEKLVKITTQVAHDIRSPLTSINAVVRHWRDRLPEDDYFTLLELSAKRLHSIANEVLDQHGPRKKGIFSLHRLLDELIGEHSAGSNGVLFEKQYGEALSVAGNRDRLQRAFGNIIKNAIEAMNGKGTLSLKTASQDGHAVIEISDTGPGMSPQVLAKALQGGFTLKKEGHGIGMEVVREVVEGHQGKIEADSTVGRGTTFRISLPLPDSSALKESEEVEEGTGQFELKAAKGEQIVVIDDDPSAQLQWELILRKLGLEPLTYESFEDYQKKSTTRPTNLKTAIIDYHYDNSELNGFQIIEKLRTQGYRNISLCTGEYWKPAVREEAKKIGVPICPKPIPKVVVKSST